MLTFGQHQNIHSISVCHSFSSLFNLVTRVIPTVHSFCKSSATPSKSTLSQFFLYTVNYMEGLDIFCVKIINFISVPLSVCQLVCRLVCRLLRQTVRQCFQYLLRPSICQLVRHYQSVYLSVYFQLCATAVLEHRFNFVDFFHEKPQPYKMHIQ